MKTLDDLADFIERKANNIDRFVAKVEQKVAEKIKDDIIVNAPYKTGAYVNSIQIYPTEIENNRITTFIGSDLTVGPTKWTGAKLYNLGFLLEHGTFQHAIPNAWGKGFYYGYTDESGRFHKGTLDENWHPGTIAQPHYRLALEKNKKLFIGNMKLIWRER